MSNMLFKGRNEVPADYSAWGYTRGGGTVWHGGIDIKGLDSSTILMPSYNGKSISGTVVTSTIITDKSNPTWEWGYYICVKLDANQTPDPVNYLYFCHNEKNLVKVGQKVKTGDVLGIMGKTGNAAYVTDNTVPHTHFEVRAQTYTAGLDPTMYTMTKNAKGVYGLEPEPEPDPVGTYKCIDVSKYQGVIDWAKVKADGYNQAFIRVGYSYYVGDISKTTDGYDEYFESNMKNAIANGIDVGVYVYSYCQDETAAIKCADDLAKLIEPYKLTMPVAFDLEDKFNIAFTDVKNSNIAKAFMQRIKEHGYYPILYSYSNFLNNYIDMSLLENFDLWVADYVAKSRDELSYKGAHTIWQYTSEGSVNGIVGNVDLNHAYVNYPEIISGKTIEDKQLEVLIENKCQAFNTKNVNDWYNFDGIPYIPLGKYDITYLETVEDDSGFKWCKIKYEDIELWVIYNLSDERCKIIDKEITPPTPVVKDYLYRVLTPNKCQAFHTKNTNDIVAIHGSLYMPLGDYTVIEVETEPSVSGLKWCKIIVESNECWAVYDVGDGRCELIEGKLPETDWELKHYEAIAEVEKLEIKNEELKEINDTLVKENAELKTEIEKLKETGEEALSVIDKIKDFFDKLFG